MNRHSGRNGAFHDLQQKIEQCGGDREKGIKAEKRGEKLSGHTDTRTLDQRAAVNRDEYGQGNLFGRKSRE